MPEINVKKTRVLVPAITAAVVMMMVTPAMMSTGAFAQSGLHFVGSPSCEPTDGSVECTGEVAGAGRTATATVEATAHITSGCINRGGNDPSGLEESTDQVTGSVDFNTRSGRGSFTVETNEVTGPAQGFECPSNNMREVLVDVTFSDITLTVTSQTGTISEEF
jgi:hypothetical protein